MCLGNKALRTGISACLCMIATKLLNLKYPFFVILPAVMPISSTLEDTIKASGNRLIGSSIGAIIGILLSLIEPTNPLLTGIGVMIIIYACKFINWENSAAIACLIFVSIMVGIKGETVWLYSLNRLLDTFIGIAITATVNTLTLSLTIYSSFIKNTRILYDDFLKAISYKIFSNVEIKIEPLYKQINNIKDLVTIYKDQIHFKRAWKIKSQEMASIYENLKCAYDELNTINSIDSTGSPNAENSEMINKIFSKEIHYKKYENSEVGIVYNYHLEKLLKTIQNVNL
ncbi:FUSC family protein [Clostridium hydrogenum]|uniref:FUSC family protein n=1 Tax=Clostridium hydrogenum TaxID=2855764 RepID=UPI001F226435|nr:aromatic acid exporter family protein [Clostridium hydrogenum]